MVILSEYDLYRVLQEEHGGRVLGLVEWSGFSDVIRESITGTLASRLELTDEEGRELRQARGGCRCQDPGAMPPCSACTEPLSVEEAEIIALVRRAEREPAPAPVLPEGWGDW